MCLICDRPLRASPPTATRLEVKGVDWSEQEKPPTKDEKIQSVNAPSSLSALTNWSSFNRDSLV